jgi:demethylmenaquinone methyltransferase / 2-methoxy-6-polyprenyl-1,4-benzoquinol methylase
VSNVFFVPGEQRGEKVGDLFATIARRYDLLNDLQSFGLHRLWKRRVVALADVKPGDRALDLCCGTGDIAFALAQKGADITGLDFSDKMLEVAQARLQNPAMQGRQIKFVQGDAQKLPFPDNSFDAVTMGYGLRNLASWEMGLQEMVRVAKPGGRIVILDFGKPANALWRGLYFTHLRCSVPVVGLLFAGRADAYAYIFESLKHYPAQWGVKKKMKELNLAKVEIVNFVGGAMAINFGCKAK